MERCTQVQQIKIRKFDCKIDELTFLFDVLSIFHEKKVIVKNFNVSVFRSKTTTVFFKQ